MLFYRIDGGTIHGYMKERQDVKENLQGENPQILIVSRKLDPHVDIIARKLNERKIPFIRFNTEDFPLRVSVSVLFEGRERKQILKFPLSRQIRGDEVTGVWYRRPADFQFPPEFSPAVHVFAEQESRATIMGLWQLLDCIWVNHPERNREAELKLKQLRVASEVGLEIPKTLVTNNPEDAERFFRRTAKSGGVIIKRLGGGIVLDGDQGSAIYTSLVSKSDMEDIERVRYTPALFQEYVPKDFELRIVVVGDKVFPVEIHSQRSEKAKIDWRKDTLNLLHKPHNLPDEISKKVINLVHRLGLNFGAIDIILTPDQRYVFLEVNPNGQWGWVEDLTGLPISDAIIDLLSGKKS